MTDNILASASSLSPGNEIELFQIDLSTAGYTGVLGFTPSNQDGDPIWFNGMQYLPRGIRVTGFKKTSDDAPPEPTMAMGNVDMGGTALLREYGDLLGAKVTRIQTFKQFLDFLPDGSPNPTADPAAKFLPEIWYIEQKTGNTPAQITWKLRSALDINDRMVPNRIILKNVCLRSYRSWNSVTNTFDYATKNACPYAGTEYYDRANNPVTPAEDACAKNMAGCLARFHDEALPGWFFPGANRLPR